MNIKLKNLIKGIYYSSLGSALRRYPSKLVYKKRNATNLSYECVNHKNRKKSKVVVLFLLEMPEIWNACKSVFEAIETNELGEAYIITLPQYPNIENYPAKRFFALNSGNVINAYNENTDTWFDLHNLDPDYIFYTRPYDKEYPDDYKPVNTCKYAKLCYIPYGFEFTKGYHIEVEYNLSFLPYTYMLFFEGITSKKYCEFFCKEDNKKLYELGYPKFDMSFRVKNEIKHVNERKTFLWTPRWSIETLANDGTSYFELIEPLLQFFSDEKNASLNLIIRPHPLMFDNFIKNGVMSKKNVDDITSKIDSLPNVSFDKNADYLESISRADYVISDFTTLLIEYLVFEVPVLYCGKTDKFDAIGRIMDDSMYHYLDYESISDAIEDFIINGDIKKDIRHEAMKTISKSFDGMIGNRITNAIIQDYFI